jgi:Bromodomain/TAZ zinc finger
MAKSLEEHLYRSAKSKEDYMDLSTLKKRLQAIAHGLEIHRSSDSAGMKQIDSAMGSAQQGASLRSSASTSDGASVAGQHANWSVAAAVRSNVGGGPGFSGLATQLNSGGNLNMSTQMSASQHGSTGLANALQQSNTMAHQGSINNIGNQGTTSPGNFLTVPGQQQVTMQESDLWSAGQSAGTGNSMMSQGVALQHQQANIFQMNQQNAGNTIGLQHNPLHQMNVNNVCERQDASVFSIIPNVSNTQTSFSNASASPTQLSQQQSGLTSWGSVGVAVPNASESGNSEYPKSSKFQDPMASQKKRVILQQQQRLLLLRHASKCNAGPQCTTKFCEQMVTLWKHMKTCRNKNCKTSHCLSSRCVLNHYRICKSNGRTSTCEVCGPVMLKIKQQERDDGSVEDPLTRDQDPIPPLQSQIPAAATTLSTTQQQQSAGDQPQLHQVQAQQSKLKAQLDSLKLLQRQQEQLLEQQKSLEAQAQNISDPNSPQARQLQEQQMLLQQLQKRCQQQQLLVQQELQMQATTVNETPAHQFPANAQAGIGQTMPSDKPNTRASQDSQMLRRGSGIGKRFGKALVLPASRRSESEEPVTKKKRGSVTKVDRSSKKPKAASKPKTDPAPEKDKPETNVAAPNKIEDEHTSLVSRMTTAEIQKHLESLNKRIVLSSRTVTHKCRPIIQELLDDQFGWVFREAVDPVALGLPDYFDVVKNPMHLDLIRNKLENAIYSDMESFARDTRLVFENAILYNGESSEVGELAQSILTRFEKSYNIVVQGMLDKS